MKLFRCALVAFSAVLLPAASRAQTTCVSTTGQVTTQLPANSGSLQGIFAMPQGSRYLYLMTQYGIARGSLADPANPGPFVLAQIGHKSIGGVDNGGKVPMVCDCWQGGTTIDAAEAADGSARMISDWNLRGGGLAAEVATADASNNVAFGQQIDIGSRVLGARVASFYLASGKFIGYFPFAVTGGGGVAVVDVTTTNGQPAGNEALEPFTTLSWGNGSAVILKSAIVGGKYLLAGAVNSEGRIRIAEVDSSTGVPTEKSSAATAGVVGSLAIASVGGRTMIFAAEGTAGVRVYEYSSGSLAWLTTLTGGNFNEVVVTGGSFPLLFTHNVVKSFPPETYIEIFDTNWVTQGGSPRHAGHLRHGGGPENFLGAGVFQARVAGNAAYIYRVQGSGGAGEAYVTTTRLDISCLSIDPNSPPIANSSATNISALARAGVERTVNYLGDRWEIEDASASSPSPPANGISTISWDWNYVAPFAPDTGWSQLPYGGANSDVNPAYFPCDPALGGVIQTGAGCWTSLGSPTAGASYRYAVQTRNDVGTSPAAPSSVITVVPPQALIAGLDTSVSPPVLKVLSGQGQADARGSQGNISEATFNWTFNPGAAAVVGQSVPVPPGSTDFNLRISYKGDYVTAVTGKINEVDLVPEFSPTQGTIFIGGNLSITNQMQKSSAVSLTSVEYSWDNGTTYAALPGTFLGAGGTASVAAPPQGTGYTLTLRYNYTKGGVAGSATVAHGPFNVSSDWTVTLSGPSTGSTNTSVSFTATVAGGSGSPSYAWCWDGCSLGGAFTPGGPTASHIYKTARTYSVVVRVTDSGVQKSKSANITITGSGTTGTLTAGLLGPTSVKPNQSVSYTATGSGGTPPYTYSWCWEGCSTGGTFEDGPSSMSHTFTSEGTYTISVRVADSASRVASRSVSVVVSNGSTGGGGLLSASLTGPSTGVTNQVVSFTASGSGGTGPYTYDWCWDACNFGTGYRSGPATNTHTYTSPGTYSLKVRVTDGARGQVTKSATITITGTSQTPPIANYTVTGAEINPFNGTYEAAAGALITLTASEDEASAYAWDFGDGTTGAGKSVTKYYNEVGSYDIRLVVTGDGTNTFGTAGSSRSFLIKQPEYPCTPGPTTLCLNHGRFKVEVAWKANNLGKEGAGQAVPMTSDTGVFWFFAPTNLELMVKVLDGSTINGYFWFFSGALSSVEYTITVTDTSNNAVKTYHNDEPNFGSIADVSAFPATPATSAEHPASATTASVPHGSGAFQSTKSTAAAEPCVAGPTTLCLNQGRFKVEVAYVGDPSGAGQSVPLTSDTGAFWFFQSSNLELMIKILDGRTINEHFWVFYGALSDVEYTITVTDTETGTVKTYHNDLHTLASAADLAAF
jgi:PKD repeat protein